MMWPIDRKNMSMDECSTLFGSGARYDANGRLVTEFVVDLGDAPVRDWVTDEQAALFAEQHRKHVADLMASGGTVVVQHMAPVTGDAERPKGAKA